MRSPKLTLQDLRNAKAQRQLTEVLTVDAEEARACEAAGIDLLVTSHEHTSVIAAAAPETFLIAGLGINDPDVCTKEDALRASFRAMQNGADAIYTGLSMPIVEALARESIPVVGHVGYVPYRESWFGVPRAVGKTCDEALEVYQATQAYEDAGAIAVEMEIVPEAIAAEITRRVSLTVISMGSGSGCDAQYLFACDILGLSTGHVPRHAKQFVDLDSALQRVQKLRVDAFKDFRCEVEKGLFPGSGNTIGIDKAELAAFRRAL